MQFSGRKVFPMNLQVFFTGNLQAHAMEWQIRYYMIIKEKLLIFNLTYVALYIGLYMLIPLKI